MTETAIVPLSTGSLVAVDGEQLVPEDVLGERLGYAKGRTFHELIETNRADIERRFGKIAMRRVTRSIEKRGAVCGIEHREVSENLLNKKQALYATTKAGTPNANDVVQELVEVTRAASRSSRA